MIKRPPGRFNPQKKDRIEYKNVSYRLPKDVVEDLNSFIDKDNSACSLVSQILKWALDDMKRKKGKK